MYTVEGQLSWGLHLCSHRDVIIHAGVTFQRWGCSGVTHAPVSNPSPVSVRPMNSRLCQARLWGNCTLACHWGPIKLGGTSESLLLGCTERGVGSTRYLDLVKGGKQLHASRGRKEGTTDSLKL